MDTLTFKANKKYRLVALGTEYLFSTKVIPMLLIPLWSIENQWTFTGLIVLPPMYIQGKVGGSTLVHPSFYFVFLTKQFFTLIARLLLNWRLPSVLFLCLAFNGTSYADDSCGFIARISEQPRSRNSMSVRQLQTGLSGHFKVKRLLRLQNSQSLVKIEANDAETARMMITAMYAKHTVTYIEPDYRINALWVPDDPLFNEQWGCHRISCDRAWDIGTGDRRAVAVVIDSGVDYLHEDLTENLWKNMGEDWTAQGIPGFNGIDDDGNGYVDDYYGFNFVELNGDVMDDYGHGTFVNGIIAAKGNNGKGICGVNWSAMLVNVKVLDSTGGGYISDAIRAIDYAVWLGTSKHIPVVVNMSWGVSQFSQALKDAMEAASRRANILFISAAGNSSNDVNATPIYPAGFHLPAVISVAAIDETGHLAWYSNYGVKGVDIAAPGSHVISTFPGNDYTYKSGTSFSTAYVTGLCLLLLNQDPDLSGTMVKSIVLNTGTYEDQLNELTATGAVVNAFRAIYYVNGPKTGDVNLDGKVNIVDALLLSKSILGIEGHGIFMEFGDMNCDGKTNIVDVLFIARYSVGIPVGCSR